eukprot:g2774.t1
MTDVPNMKGGVVSATFKNVPLDIARNAAMDSPIGGRHRLIGNSSSLTLPSHSELIVPPVNKVAKDRAKSRARAHRYQLAAHKHMKTMRQTMANQKSILHQSGGLQSSVNSSLSSSSIDPSLSRSFRNEKPKTEDVLIRTYQYNNGIDSMNRSIARDPYQRKWVACLRTTAIPKKESTENNGKDSKEQVNQSVTIDEIRKRREKKEKRKNAALSGSGVIVIQRSAKKSHQILSDSVLSAKKKRIENDDKVTQDGDDKNDDQSLAITLEDEDEKRMRSSTTPQGRPSFMLSATPLKSPFVKENLALDLFGGDDEKDTGDVKEELDVVVKEKEIDDQQSQIKLVPSPDKASAAVVAISDSPMSLGNINVNANTQTPKTREKTKQLLPSSSKSPLPTSTTKNDSTNTTQLKDLCDADKAKVAKLVKQLLNVGESVQKIEMEKKDFEQRLKALQQKEQEAAEEAKDFKRKYTANLRILKRYQEMMLKPKPLAERMQHGHEAPPLPTTSKDIEISNEAEIATDVLNNNSSNNVESNEKKDGIEKLSSKKLTISPVNREHANLIGTIVAEVEKTTAQQLPPTKTTRKELNIGIENSNGVSKPTPRSKTLRALRIMEQSWSPSSKIPSPAKRALYDKKGHRYRPGTLYSHEEKQALDAKQRSSGLIDFQSFPQPPELPNAYWMSGQDERNHNDESMGNNVVQVPLSSFNVAGVSTTTVGNKTERKSMGTDVLVPDSARSNLSSIHSFHDGVSPKFQNSRQPLRSRSSQQNVSRNVSREIRVNAKDVGNIVKKNEKIKKNKKKSRKKKKKKGWRIQGIYLNRDNRFFRDNATTRNTRNFVDYYQESEEKENRKNLTRSIEQLFTSTENASVRLDSTYEMSLFDIVDELEFGDDVNDADSKSNVKQATGAGLEDEVMEENERSISFAKDDELVEEVIREDDEEGMGYDEDKVSFGSPPRLHQSKSPERNSRGVELDEYWLQEAHVEADDDDVDYDVDEDTEVGWDGFVDGFEKQKKQKKKKKKISKVKRKQKQKNQQSISAPYETTDEESKRPEKTNDGISKFSASLFTVLDALENDEKKELKTSNLKKKKKQKKKLPAKNMSKMQHEMRTFKKERKKDPLMVS